MSRGEFHKCSQLFIRTHNEPLSVAGDVRQQSRSCVRVRLKLTHSPNSIRLY